jgi:cytochrome c peroxidase
LVSQGLTVQIRRSVPGFTQCRVNDDVEATALDLTWDTRLHPAQSTVVGPALATDDLAADKTLALFGRAEARDYVDVFRAVYSRAELLRRAGEKDRGFSAARFAEAIERIDRFEPRDFPIDEAPYAELRREFDDWRRSLTIERSPDRDPLRPRRTEREPPGFDLG